MSHICDRLEIAGPGFVNITLKPTAIAGALAAMDSPGLGVPSIAGAQTVAVDLCGVNVAKQMHVGHLRATIIGDTIARLYERLGWRVFLWSEDLRDVVLVGASSGRTTLATGACQLQ